VKEDRWRQAGRQAEREQGEEGGSEGRAKDTCMGISTNRIVFAG
jgi:hypothetical protein